MVSFYCCTPSQAPAKTPWLPSAVSSSLRSSLSLKPIHPKAGLSSGIRTNQKQRTRKAGAEGRKKRHPVELQGSTELSTQDRCAHQGTMSIRQSPRLPMHNLICKDPRQTVCACNLTVPNTSTPNMAAQLGSFAQWSQSHTYNLGMEAWCHLHVGTGGRGNSVIGTCYSTLSTGPVAASLCPQGCTHALQDMW